MTLSDVSLIGKKILVGIIVTTIPFIIIAGGLWLTQRLLTAHDTTKTTVEKTSKPANDENRKSNP